MALESCIRNEGYFLGLYVGMVAYVDDNHAADLIGHF